MAEDHEVVLEVRGMPGQPGRMALLLRDQFSHRAEREFDVDLRRRLPGREGDWEAFLDRYIRSQSSSEERRVFGDELFRALTEHDEFAYVWHSMLGASARRPYRLVGTGSVSCRMRVSTPRPGGETATSTRKVRSFSPLLSMTA